MHGSSNCFTAAAVQATPVFLDREATLAQAAALIAEAAGNGARLFAFPKVFIAGYPYWLWGGRAEQVPNLEQKAFAALWREAIDVPGPETARSSRGRSPAWKGSSMRRSIWTGSSRRGTAST